MADRRKLGPRRRGLLTDYAVATFGALPTAAAGYGADQTKGPEALVSLIGKVAGAGLKEFKNSQGVFGEGSRDNGFADALKILDSLKQSDGTYLKSTLLGARDALLGYMPRQVDSDYLRAHRGMWAANEDLSSNDNAYPRTIDGYRGGLLAGTATIYGVVVGEPMLSRTYRATTKTKPARWSPGNLVFGSGSSVAGSTLDAIKEIVERSTDGLTNSTTQLAAAGSAIEEWRNLLASLEADRSGSLATSAIHAAQKAIDEVERATQTSSSASDLIKSWAHDL